MYSIPTMEVKATLKKPFSEEDRLSFIVDNNHSKGWQINEIDTELQALGYSDLEMERALKLQKLRDLKILKLHEFSYMGKTYQIDINSKLNINGKVSAILLAQSTEQPIMQVRWIAKDNSITQFTTLEFLAFSNAVAEHIEQILFLNDTIRAQINEAKNIEALKAIELKLENEA